MSTFFKQAMPNGDSKSGAVAPPKAQEKVEKPGMEQLNENYFKRVNDEFEKIVKEKPEEMINMKLIDDIAKRHEASFEKKVIDGLKKPDEALTWGGNMLKVYAASWIAEITGLKKYVSVLKDKINGLIEKGKIWFGEKGKGIKGKLEGLKKQWGFGEKEEAPQKVPETEKMPEKKESGIEMEDLEKVYPNYARELKEFLLPVKDFVVTNKELVTALTAYGLLKNVDRVKSSAGFGKDLLLGLARMPWPKKLAGFAAMLGMFGLLLHLNKKHEIGKIQVPKDSKNFKAWIKKELEEKKDQVSEFLHTEELGEKLDHLDLHVELVHDLLEGKKKIADFFANPKDALKEIGDALLEGAKELIRSRPNEYVNRENQRGFESFLVDIERWALKGTPDQAQRIQDLERLVKGIVADLKRGRPLAFEKVLELQNAFQTLGPGYEIVIHEGYLLWRKVSELGVVVEGPKYIGMDPRLPLSEQFDKAWEFWTVPEGAFTGVFLKGPTVMKYQAQHAADMILDAVENGGVLYLLGVESPLAMLSIGAKKYVIGPWEFVQESVEQLWKLRKGKKGWEEMNGYEFGLNWAEGFLPVFALGLARHVGPELARGRLRTIFNIHDLSKFVFIESLAYPVTGLGRDIQYAWKGWKAYREGNLGEFLRNPLYQVHDLFFEIYLRTVKTGFLRRRWSVTAAKAQERLRQAALYEASYYLRKATSPMFTDPPQALLDKARLALKDAGLAGSIEFANENRADAERALQKIQEKIREIDTSIRSSVEDVRQKTSEGIGQTEKAGADKARREQAEAEGKKLQQDLDGFYRELQERRKYIVDTARAKKKAITDPDVIRQLQDLEKSMGGRISAAQENLKKWYHGAHPELGREPATGGPKTGHPPVPEIPTPGAPGKEVKPPKPPSKIRRLGLHFLGLGGGIAASAALGIGLGKGLEALSEKEDEFSIEPVQKRRKPESREKRSLEDEGLRLFEAYAKGFNIEYSRMFDQLDYEKLKMYAKEDSLSLVVNKMGEEHRKIVEDMKGFLEVSGNQELLFGFYEKLAGWTAVDVKKPKKLTEYFALSFDPSRKQLLFHYADEDDFKGQIYHYVDFVMRHDGKTEASQSDLVTDALQYATPGLGIYMDARDTYNAVRRGQFWQATKSGLWTGVGAVADLAMFTGVGALVTGVVRGTTLAAKTARAAKVATAVGLGGSALDVTWQVFTPKHSQVIRIQKPPFRMPDTLKPMTASEVVPDGIAPAR